MLLVYNITGAPITIATTSVVVPLSPSPPSRGPAVNVTSELKTKTAGQFASIEAQRPAALEYEWTSDAEYDTFTLVVEGPDPGPHAATHLPGGADALTTAAAGAVTVGAAAAVGAAASFARSDHTHSVASPAAPADVTKAAASAGASGSVARADHKHDISTAAAGALVVGDVAAEGAASSLARSDHKHGFAAPTMLGDVTGTTSASVVSKIDGASVPAAGGLTTGNVLQVIGASALSYAAVNLGGGSDHVSGILPSARTQDGTAAGAALTDADVTITRSQGFWRTLPAATLSADHTVTLGTTSAVAGDIITVTRLDETANQLFVVGAQTFAMPNSKKNFCDFQYDGAAWQFKRGGTQ